MKITTNIFCKTFVSFPHVVLPEEETVWFLFFYFCNLGERLPIFYSQVSDSMPDILCVKIGARICPRMLTTNPFLISLLLLFLLLRAKIFCNCFSIHTTKEFLFCKTENT